MSQVLVPAGGGSLPVHEWVAALGRDYLAGYLRAGGAAVKVAVAGSDDVAVRLADELRAASRAGGYCHVLLEAATTRVHMVDQVFLAVSRSVDWDAVAGAVLTSAYERIDLPASGRLSVQAVAVEHDVDPGELSRSIRRQLERDVLDDEGVARELRLALLRLCQWRLGRGDVTDDEHEAVLAWLRGEQVTLARLRSASLYRRITRQTARPLLASLPRVLARSGQAGLVLQLDLSRLVVSRRPPLEQRDGHYYSRAAVFDAWEVLRQLFDGLDDLAHLLVVAVVPPSLVTDDNRGIPAYSALHLRVADEVRDRRRANPYASLVRLEVRLEAVA